MYSFSESSWSCPCSYEFRATEFITSYYGTSRPTLDKILNGEIDSKSTFDKHLNKILTSLSIDPDTLMGFSPRMQSVDAVFSENAPIDYQVNDKAKMEYDLLQDILNLCSVYY